MKQPITVADVESRIAEIMQRTQGMNPQRLLDGEDFLSLDKNFDSLSMVEVQLLIEETFHIEFDQKAFSDAAKMPRTLQQLALIVLGELSAGQSDNEVNL